MGRRRGGGGRRSSSSGGGLFGRSKRSAPPPAKKKAAPPPAAPQQGGGGGMLGGMMGMVGQGLAFGTGSAIAHRAVDAVVGPRTVQHEHTGEQQQQETTSNANQGFGSSSSVCQNENVQFQQCLRENPGAFSNCQMYYDVLTQCQANPSASNW